MAEKPRQILIVDDEEGILELYKEELSDEGYVVSTSEDGQDILGKIERFKPDLIILDIKIGGYNGLELLQDIRDKYSHLPVILCSAYSTFKTDIKTLAADSYVVKSSDLTELKSRIKSILAKAASSTSA